MANRINIIRVIFLLSLLVLSAPPTVFALDQIKDNIFKDCNAAITDAGNLSLEDKRQLLEYTTKILALKKDMAPTVQYEPVINLDLTNPRPAPTNLSRRFDFSSAYQPQREEQAKDCALKILDTFAPYSIEESGNLIRLLNEPNLPDTWKTKIADLLWQITLKVKTDIQYKVFPSTIHDLALLTASEYGYLAINIILELNEQSIRHLVQGLKNPDRSHRQAMVELLVKLDYFGDLIGEYLLPLLDSSDDDLRIRAILLLGRYPSFYAQSLPLLHAALADPVLEVKQATIHTLAKVSQQPDIIKAYDKKEQLFQALLPSLQDLDANVRGSAQAALCVLVTEVNNPLLALTPFFRSDLADTKAKTLLIVAQIKAAASRVLPICIENAYSKYTSVGIAAMSCARNLASILPNDVARFLSQFTRSIEKEKDDTRKLALLKEVARAIISLPSNQISSFTGFLLEALASYGQEELFQNGIPNPDFQAIIKALAGLGSSSRATITKLLKQSQPVQRYAGILIAKQLPVSKIEILGLLTPALKEEDHFVRTTLIDTLSAQGTDIVPQLEKILGQDNIKTKFLVAQLLANMGKTTPPVTLALIEGFAKLSCYEKTGTTFYFAGIEDKAREQVAKEFLPCLYDSALDSETLSSAWQKLSPLTPASQEIILTQYNTQQLSLERFLIFAEHSTDYGFSAEKITQLLLPLLEAGSNARKLQVISSLAVLKQAAAPAGGQLVKLAENAEQDDLLANKAVEALIQIDAAAFDYNAFFVRELASDKYLYAQQTIRNLPALVAAPIIVQAAAQLSEDKKNRLFKLFLTFPDLIAKQRQQISALLNSNNDLTRAQALILLMHLDLPFPELEGSFRKELIGRYSDRLINESPVAIAKKYLEAAVVSAQSFVEKRNAEVYLSKLQN
ncbi:MAG: HEAT repeat domain-containing protein [Deltaproteobacteria bacterium]|nr:HEAT repeat domain-containing protein [Deltaproteobacteria bacterium]